MIQAEMNKVLVFSLAEAKKVIKLKSNEKQRFMTALNVYITL